MEERTLVLIKPDAVQRRLIGEIITRFERRGLRIVAMKMLWMDREMAERHYAAHRGKSFFEPLIEFITSGPLVAMVLEGKRAISVVRQTMGATDPGEADPGTIRGDFAMEIRYNLVHGSDSPETAEREIALFFREDEIFPAPRLTDRVVYMD